MKFRKHGRNSFYGVHLISEEGIGISRARTLTHEVDGVASDVALEVSFFGVGNNRSSYKYFLELSDDDFVDMVAEYIKGNISDKFKTTLLSLLVRNIK